MSEPPKDVLCEDGFSLKDYLISIEKDLILRALGRCSWNKAAAARRLRLKRTALLAKMKRYGMVTPPEFVPPYMTQQAKKF